MNRHAPLDLLHGSCGPTKSASIQANCVRMEYREKAIRNDEYMIKLWKQPAMEIILNKRSYLEKEDSDNEIWEDALQSPLGECQFSISDQWNSVGKSKVEACDSSKFKKDSFVCKNTTEQIKSFLNHQIQSTIASKNSAVLRKKDRDLMLPENSKFSRPSAQSNIAASQNHDKVQSGKQVPPLRHFPQTEGWQSLQKLKDKHERQLKMLEKKRQKLQSQHQEERKNFNLARQMELSRFKEQIKSYSSIQQQLRQSYAQRFDKLSEAHAEQQKFSRTLKADLYKEAMTPVFHQSQSSLFENSWNFNDHRSKLGANYSILEESPEKIRSGDKNADSSPQGTQTVTPLSSKTNVTLPLSGIEDMAKKGTNRLIGKKSFQQRKQIIEKALLAWQNSNNEEEKVEDPGKPEESHWYKNAKKAWNNAEKIGRRFSY